MKIAFFVEGYTEQILIKELALYYYGKHNLSYSLYRLRGGNKVPVNIRLDEKHEATNQNPEYTLSVFDCGGLTTIRSMISHQRNSLYNSGFQKIVGIRDVHPNQRGEIPKLKMSLPLRIPQKPIQTIFLLCVMETESWFIAEYTHFLRISPILTLDFIRSKVGIDLETFNVELFDTPGDKLNEIYQQIGESYEKNLASISRTVNSLDFISLFYILPEKIPSLKKLIQEIE